MIGAIITTYGRLKTMKTNKTERIALRLTTEELANLKKMAEYEELNLSEMIRQLLNEKIGGNR